MPPVTLEQGTGMVRLARGPVGAEIRLDPFSVRVEREGEDLVGGLTPFAQTGTGGDRLIHLTEGVLVEEELGEPEPVGRAEVAESNRIGVVLAGVGAGGRGFEVEVSLPGPERVLLRMQAAGGPFRLGTEWPAAEGERFTGLGARHCEGFDQRGRAVRLGADRRYTGPDCPPEMLEHGGVPQGDYAPVPWLLSSGGWAAWGETWGPGVEVDLTGRVAFSQRAAAGELRLHLLCDPTPLARLRHYLRLTGMPALLAEWAYGHWKSRDVYEHQRDVLEDFDGYRENRIPLDAIVIDSPWETQYNTWRFNPHQFPDPEVMITRLRADGVRTVVWVTPWVNVESADGQRPPGPESEALHRAPASNYEAGADGGHFVRNPDGGPHVGRWWMGTGSIVDFTSHEARCWWREQAREALALGIEGIKADDGEGYYLPPHVRLADGRRGADAAWAYGELYRRVMQEALDEAHPGTGVLFGRSGWTGQQAVGVTWGGDQVSDFWSLRALLVATLTAAASGYSNWSHDVGGYLGRRLVERCPRELLLRWVQFGCFTPLMQAHGRFPQEAWRYDDATLAIYRDYVLLHERLVAYIRAAAATAARSGVPIIRPLALIDPDDPAGWRLADAYGFGPALWVAPVLVEGATERRVRLPRGEWFDFWSGEPVIGGRDAIARAPRDRIPAWVRRGAIIPTYPAETVAEGLGDIPERERPLEATLWGRPRCGRAAVRLADGTMIRWVRGSWSVSSEAREVRFRDAAAPGQGPVGPVP